MRVVKHFAMITVLVLLTGCAMNYGVPLSVAEHRIVDIPPLEASFTPVPMRIAIYIAPEAANALFLSDLRNTANGNLLSYGKLGPGILAGVTEYFPKAFAEVFVISDFPHVVVDAADIDAVVVFESAQGSGHTHDTSLMEPINDVLLNMGIYSPAGERLLGYQVIASPKFKLEWDMNIMRATQRGYESVTESARIGVRLALLKFPAKQGYTAALADRQKRAGALADVILLEQRAQVMRGQIAEKAPRIAGTPRDAMSWAGEMTKTVNVLTAVAATLSAGLAAVPGASGFATISGTLSNTILNANKPGSETGQGKGILMEFLGGVAAASQQRAAMFSAVPRFAPPGTLASVCQQLSSVQAACTVDECRKLFREATQTLACGG